MNFRDGGIVSFANGELVTETSQEDIERDRQRIEAIKRKTAEDAAYQAYVEGRRKDPVADEYVPASTARPPESASAVKAMVEGSQLEQAGGAQRGSGPRPPTVGGGKAPGGAPQAGAPTPENMYDTLMKRSEARTASQPELPEDLRKKMAEYLPYLNTQPGSKLEEMHTRITQRDEEDRARFLKNEEQRKQGRLNRGLMAGAEATRGQGGIGALGSFFMGFNKANEAEDESAMSRMDAQRKIEREQEVLRATVLGSIEDARRAGQEGRFKDQKEALAKVAEANNKLEENKLATAVAITTSKEAQRHNMSVEEYQRAQLRYAQMSASKGPEIEQNYNFILKNSGLSPAKAYEEAMRISRGGIADAALKSREMHQAQTEFQGDKTTASLIMDVKMAGSDPVKRQKATDALNQHERSFYARKGLPLPEGSGGDTVDLSKFGTPQKVGS
jgi:hypothetical protein